MRKIRRMVSVVIIFCMMAGCLAGCGSGRETGGTHGERQGTESRSGTERESIAERYRQKAIKEEFEENIAESGQSQQNMAVPECIEEEACDSVVSAADTYNSVMDSASNSESDMENPVMIPESITIRKNIGLCLLKIHRFQHLRQTVIQHPTAISEVISKKERCRRQEQSGSKK